jgi:enhancer of mRNA-decapping protein 4
VTPAGHLLDSALVQEDLVRLISEGQYNQAFQQALSASDLSLVMFLCSRASPHTVFAPTGCLLQQHVLLSLIQQLSADMSSHNDIKHRYIFS